MALGWTGAALEQLKGDVRPGVLLRLDTPTPLRLWTAGGPLTIPTDSIETDAENEYLGIGALVELPAINQLINGVAQRVDFILSGPAVTAEIAALAAEEAEDVRGAEAVLGVTFFDKDWQIASPTLWRPGWTADSVKIARSPGEDYSANYTIGMSVGSLFTGRKRPTPAFFTDQDQRRRSSDDRFCDRVSIIAQGATKFWPS